MSILFMCIKQTKNYIRNDTDRARISSLGKGGHTKKFCFGGLTTKKINTHIFLYKKN